ncbi:hypothetical protein [Oceanobacillus timonensis]|uniref:hypothetical protein n=1 Tax=Oceanobacillus timonensis TaxID=1926285 RepID=UPI0009BAFF48|nr:hypothetical protein [Oceanobacillus timonensis]
MKQHVRAFAIGLLTSGALLLAIYLFGNSSSGNLEDTEPEELISVLEDQGYAVLTQDEYIAYSVDKEDAEEADADEETSDEQDTNNDSADSENTDDDSNDENSDNEGNRNDEDSNENEDNDDNNSEGNEDDESSEEDSDVIEAEITLEDGAPPSSISNALEDEGIIDDAWDFNEYLEDNDLSGSVIPGTYEIDSDMSFSEIGDVITTYSDD